LLPPGVSPAVDVSSAIFHVRGPADPPGRRQGKRREAPLLNYFPVRLAVCGAWLMMRFATPSA
jgi:hypothetical protein